jgi:hypothetical protein
MLFVFSSKVIYDWLAPSQVIEFFSPFMRVSSPVNNIDS